MRVGCVALALAIATVGCGDDDSSLLRDAGFSRGDAAINQCVPYYLASGRCELGLDAATDAHPVVNLSGLSCARVEGAANAECADLAWDFACGEHLDLIGCCTTQGRCGVLDPTGVLGCVDRQFFGASEMQCTADAGMDAGHEADSGTDEDASVPTT